MSAQLPLAFRVRAGSSLGDFIPGRNLQIVNALKILLSEKGEPQIYISGAAGSGKTHLLMGLVEAAGDRNASAAYLPLRELSGFSPGVLDNLAELDLLVFDDMEAIRDKPGWQEAMFVLFNQAREQKTRLVFTANQGPASLPLALADLKSRLAWGVSYTLQPLDDQDKMDLLIIQAGKRGLTLKQDAAQYLLTRCKRDTRALLQTLDQLDRASLAAQRKLTLPFVREQLQAINADTADHG